jgi:hypothetical protein
MEQMMNSAQIEELLQNVQSSRGAPTRVLYQGDLQLGTDQYYKANKLYSQDDVPDGPAKIFRNYGATTEIDNREYMLPNIQVPRDPELDALNEYFGQQRIEEFARSQSKLQLPEYLAKEAENQANALVKDEIDRRSGIRRSVLEATGMTPAQISEEMTRNTLAGINPRLVDVRDRQVQDAVNMYYAINNIPLPVSAPQTETQSIQAAIPTEQEFETSEVSPEAMALEKFGEAPEDEDAASRIASTERPATGSDPAAETPGRTRIVPNFDAPFPDSDDQVDAMAKGTVVGILLREKITVPGVTSDRSGKMNSLATFDSRPLGVLRDALKGEIAKRQAAGR